MEKGTGIIIGIAIGTAIGIATGGLGLWIAVGVVLGVLIENGDLGDLESDFFGCSKSEE